MRIVSGEFKGRSIAAPKGRETRPTGDRVRESIMSAVMSRLGGFAGVSALDAFAGSGAMGLEALSRGADRVTFYETDRHAQSTIRANITGLDVASRATLIGSDILRAADRDDVAGAPFSLLFLDPPYRLGAESTFALMERLARAGALTPGAIVVYESAKGEILPVPPVGFDVVSTRSFGDTSFALLEYEPNER